MNTLQSNHPDTIRRQRAVELLTDAPLEFHEIYPDAEPAPRYLVLEKSAGSIIHAFPAETFAYAAEQVDGSETEGLDDVRVIDLDTQHEYQADRRTVGFNFVDAPNDVQAPGTKRIDITPTHLSTFQPAPFVALSGREAATILHALRVQEEVTPLDSEEIDALCERINFGTIHVTGDPVPQPAPKSPHADAVIVTVRGGVAEVATPTPGFNVCIVDYDNLNDLLRCGDSPAELQIILEPEAREFIRNADPEFHAELLPFLAPATKESK